MNNEIWITEGDCCDPEEIVIPSKYEGKKVPAIPEEGFNDCEALTLVPIPDIITTIGDNAFCFCGGFQSLYMQKALPSSVMLHSGIVFLWKALLLIRRINFTIPKMMRSVMMVCK